MRIPAVSGIDLEPVNASASDTLQEGKITALEDHSASTIRNTTSGTNGLYRKGQEDPLTPSTEHVYSKFRTVLLVATMTTAMIINTANSTTVQNAIPTIGRELNLDEGDLQWLASAYPLSSGCLLLAFGRVADLYGRKTTFLIGSAFLTVFTLACGFPNSIVVLNVLRGIQGIGAAATIPAAVGILAHHFPPGRARSWAYATFSAGAPLGGIFGSAVGGVLTQSTAKTWRSPFYLMAGITFLSVVCGWFSIPQDRHIPGTDKRIDWLGALIVSAGLVLVVFVLGQGELAPQKWRTPYIIALLILGVFLIGVFLFWQHHLERVHDDPQAAYSVFTPPPLMKISIWTRDHGRLSAMLAIIFLEWCSFFGWSFWVQLYYQNYVGLTPLQTVLRVLPMTISGLTCNVFIGLFISYIPIVYLTAIGTGATATACLLLALVTPEVTYWAYGFTSAAIVVLGADFVFSAGTIYVAKVAHPDEQSVAGGLFNTMGQLGTAVGVSVSTVVFNSVTSRQDFGDGSLQVGVGQNLSSYHAAQWTNFAFGIAGTGIAVIFFRSVGVVGDRKREQTIDEEGASTSATVLPSTSSEKLQ